MEEGRPLKRTLKNTLSEGISLELPISPYMSDGPHVPSLCTVRDLISWIQVYSQVDSNCHSKTAGTLAKYVTQC